MISRGQSHGVRDMMQFGKNLSRQNSNVLKLEPKINALKSSTHGNLFVQTHRNQVGIEKKLSKEGMRNWIRGAPKKIGDSATRQ